MHLLICNFLNIVSVITKQVKETDGSNAILIIFDATNFMLSDNEKKITLSFLKSFAKTFIFSKKKSLLQRLCQLTTSKVLQKRRYIVGRYQENYLHTVYLLYCTEICSKFCRIFTTIASTNVLPVLPYFAQPCWLTIPWGNISSGNLLPLGNERLGTYYHFEGSLVYCTSCVT